MTRSTLRLLLASVVAALALVVAACGGSDNDNSGGGGSSSSGGGSASSETGQPRQGGALKVLGASDVDYVDPGHTYFTTGYQLAYAINRPLYGFKPGSNDPVPDVAAGAPQISDDLKQITVKIKPNIKFA